MPGIEIKGRSKIANYRHGGRTRKFGGGRTNLLEQLGRVEAEPSNPNRRAEISRVHGELNRGYAKGGRAGYGIGSIVKYAAKKFKKKKVYPETESLTHQKGPYVGDVGSEGKKGRKYAPVETKARDAAEKKERREELRKKARKSGGHSKIVFADEWKHIDPGLQKGLFKKDGGRIGLKKGKAVTKSDLAKRDLWTKRELKRRSKIGQRKSKWDIKGAISGHPLNPLRIHAAEKATDWTKMYKDTYGRTRDELKKSQDPAVKKVAEGFQQMDYKDKAKGTYEEKDYAPKRKKPIHSMRGDLSSSGRVDREGLKKGGKSDKKWIQKAVDPKHKGYCTPMTKKTCTPARKALARTFKKKAKTGWG